MEQELTLLCQKTFGGEHAIQGLRRLTGGANAATWSRTDVQGRGI